MRGFWEFLRRLLRRTSPPVPTTRPISVLMYGQPTDTVVTLESPQGRFRALTEAILTDQRDVRANFPAIPYGMKEANLFIEDPTAEFYGIVVSLPEEVQWLVVGSYPIPLDKPEYLHLPALVRKPKTPRIRVDGLVFRVE